MTLKTALNRVCYLYLYPTQGPLGVCPTIACKEENVLGCELVVQVTN